jgi:Phage tail sheath protein FI
MLQLSAPGVYVEEVQSGARPITAVGTSTAGFIGLAGGDDAPVGVAKRIGNWQQFVSTFMKGESEDRALPMTDLVTAVYGFYQNGGSTCYVINMGMADPKDATKTKFSVAQCLEEFKKIDEIAIVVAPGFTGKADIQAVLNHCEAMKDRFAILDAQRLDDVDALCADCTPSKLGYGAVYFPWISIASPALNQRNTAIVVPPSGHIAGIYARVDGSVGVHKAPANETINGALDLSYHLTQDEIGKLNLDNINCIKTFPGGDIRVWGARTRSDPSSPWKYVNVRRLFIMIEESIAKSTTWVVFQPNDFTLWNSIIRDVSAFLRQVWRQGALQGSRPEEAFYVKCDRETNPQEDIDAGRVTIEIGIAPVKPAEFVVFRIGQTESGAVRI